MPAKQEGKPRPESEDVRAFIQLHVPRSTVRSDPNVEMKDMQNKMRLGLHLLYYLVDLAFYGACFVVGAYYLSLGQDHCPPSIPFFLFALGGGNLLLGSCRCFCFEITCIVLYVFNVAMMIFGGIVVIGNYYRWQTVGARRKGNDRSAFEFCQGVPYVGGFVVEVILIVWLSGMLVCGMAYAEIRARRRRRRDLYGDETRLRRRGRTTADEGVQGRGREEWRGKKKKEEEKKRSKKELLSKPDAELLMDSAEAVVVVDDET